MFMPKKWAGLWRPAETLAEPAWAAGFSTALSTDSVDMPDIPEQRAMTQLSVSPDAPQTAPAAEAKQPLRPSRRRRATPLDPRRGPAELAQPDDAAPAPPPPVAGGIANGVAVLRAALRNVPGSPGVYRMLDRKGDALYVGKARNLKARVQNYTHPLGLSNRLRRMVAETASFEIVVTHTEAEALLLECNMIKRLMPRFNVLLRDDKSFPFIHLTADADFPQLTKHRGARGDEGDYFGPFASAGAVNRTLIALQRAFLLRSCADSVFSARTRPCLLYQIKRCSAPCTGRIDHDGYARLVAEARGFLSGRSQEVQARLAKHMQELSGRREYESAAVIRDRIRALTQVQGRQDINLDGLGDADVVALHQAGGNSSIQVFFFRGGQNWGNRAYFPAHARDLDAGDVMGAFLGQFYDNKPPPPQILISRSE